MVKQAVKYFSGDDGRPDEDVQTAVQAHGLYQYYLPASLHVGLLLYQRTRGCHHGLSLLGRTDADVQGIWSLPALDLLVLYLLSRGQPAYQEGTEYRWGLMQITVSGLPGSGTTTLSRLLSEYYELELISSGEIFRKMAKERGMSLAEFGALRGSLSRFRVARSL